MSPHVVVHLTGDFSPKGTNKDDALLDFRRPDGSVILQDNEYGLDRREYPAHVIARVDYK